MSRVRCFSSHRLPPPPVGFQRTPVGEVAGDFGPEGRRMILHDGMAEFVDDQVIDQREGEVNGRWIQQDDVFGRATAPAAVGWVSRGAPPRAKSTGAIIYRQSASRFSLDIR
jgi:hypothetical protein